MPFFYFFADYKSVVFVSVSIYICLLSHIYSIIREHYCPAGVVCQ
jgi:hypothetical protein